MSQTIETHPDQPAFSLPPGELVELFSTGELEVLGRMQNSSNATLLVKASDGQKTHLGIYKPEKGERPLRDFPDGIYRREVAVYEVAKQLGWHIIPPTTIADGPHGIGSVQAFINADFSQHYFSMMEDGVGGDDLRRICVLDLVTNNTDRKSGHCMLDYEGLVYGIDNGLALHAQWKLRTVMWDFVGEEIAEEDLAALKQFASDGPGKQITDLLSPFEVDALMTRTLAVIEDGHFPEDETGGRRWPWPII